MYVHLKFTCKYTLDFNDNYVFVEKHNFMVNLKTNRIINQVMKGGSIGYVIGGKFYSLTRLKKSIVKIKVGECPF